MKKLVYDYLNSQNVKDYWDNQLGYYNTTQAAEEVIGYLGITDEYEEQEIHEIVSDWFDENQYPIK